MTNHDYILLDPDQRSWVHDYNRWCHTVTDLVRRYRNKTKMPFDDALNHEPSHFVRFLEDSLSESLRTPDLCPDFAVDPDHLEVEYHSQTTRTGVTKHRIQLGQSHHNSATYGQMDFITCLFHTESTPTRPEPIEPVEYHLAHIRTALPNPPQPLSRFFQWFKSHIVLSRFDSKGVFFYQRGPSHDDDRRADLECYISPAWCDLFACDQALDETPRLDGTIRFLYDVHPNVASSPRFDIRYGWDSTIDPVQDWGVWDQLRPYLDESSADFDPLFHQLLVHGPSR